MGVTSYCLKEEKNGLQSKIVSDKLLSRVRQYATGTLKEQIESGLANLISILDTRIIEEQQADEVKIAEITARYQAHIEDADREASDMRVKAEQEKYRYFESIVADMKSATTVFAYEKVRDRFLALGKYEDAVILANKCQSEICRINEEERQEKARLVRKAMKVSIISVSAIVVVIAVIMVIVKVIIPTNKYNKAIELMNNGQYSEAITVFENLNEYKDSNEQITSCQIAIDYNEAIKLMNNAQYKDAIDAFEKLDGYKDSNMQIYSIRSSAEYIGTLSIGDTFYYGNYKEKPIEWTILDIQNKQVFAITTNAVDLKKYNNTMTDVTWSSCSLRAWLNKDFINAAFSSEEESKIMTTTVNPGKNPEYETDAGSSTNDKIFILSIDEANQYFSTDGSRKCTYNGNACWWWLRSPGNNQNYAAAVNIDSSVDYSGHRVDSSNHAVRPALWINLDA